MSTVNPQITDAVTQVNTKIVADAPRVAMATHLENLAHAAGILFENAVVEQQQQNVIAQAALSQAIEQMNSLVVASIARNAADANCAEPADLQAAVGQALATLKSAAPAEAGSSVSRVIEEAVVSADDRSFMNDTRAFQVALSQGANEMASAIKAINNANQYNAMRIINVSASALVMTAMLVSPARFKEYQQILDQING